MRPEAGLQIDTVQVIANLDKVAAEGECADSNINSPLEEFNGRRKVEEQELQGKWTSGKWLFGLRKEGFSMSVGKDSLAEGEGRRLWERELRGGCSACGG